LANVGLSFGIYIHAQTLGIQLKKKTESEKKINLHMSDFKNNFKNELSIKN
jgi:hypothetical protein